MKGWGYEIYRRGVILGSRDENDDEYERWGYHGLGLKELCIVIVRTLVKYHSLLWLA